MELLSDVLETGSSIQVDRTQQVETGTARKTANCGFHCTEFYENSFILKNSGNHQHRENYKRFDVRDDGPILQRAVQWWDFWRAAPELRNVSKLNPILSVRPFLLLLLNNHYNPIIFRASFHLRRYNVETKMAWIAFCILHIVVVRHLVSGWGVELHNETEIKPGARTTCVLWTLERPSIKMSIAQRFTIL